MKLFDCNQMFDVEITTRCNKRCRICPRKNFIRRDRDMSANTFEKLRAWLPSGCDIFFAGYGEPLLHDGYIDFIRMLSKDGIRTSILTNGNLLSDEKICELYNVGLHKLQISILPEYDNAEIKKYVDMTDREFYSKTQFNLLYEDMTETLKQLANNLKNLGFKVYLKRVHSRGGELYKVETDNACCYPCGTFLNVTYIDTNGEIQICSNDINGKYNIGNIDTMTFNALMDKKHELSKSGMIAPICNFCDDEYRIINRRKYGDMT